MSQMSVLAAVLSALLLVSVLGASVFYLFFLPKGKDDNTNREDTPQRGPQQRRGRRARFRDRRREAARHEASDEDEPEEVAPSEEDVLSDRQRRMQAYDEKRRARDAEREAQEEEEAAERLRKAEERRRQEEEEAAKWAEFITVEEQGENEEEDNDEENLLGQFVDLIKKRKIVVLEDLAVEYGIKTQEVIHRIEALETAGRVTGVMDDRGKYLYISEDEMQCVAEYIVSRGRVSIRELAHVSHRFVDLESKT